MMDRRQFLKRLVGVAAVTAAPVYFFPPTGGWTRLESGVWANNTAGTPLWASKTPAEIMADVNATWKLTNVLLVSTFARMSGESDEALKRRFARTSEQRVVICSPRLGGLSV